MSPMQNPGFSASPPTGDCQTIFTHTRLRPRLVSRSNTGLNRKDEPFSHGDPRTRVHHTGARPWPYSIVLDLPRQYNGMEGLNSPSAGLPWPGTPRTRRGLAASQPRHPDSGPSGLSIMQTRRPLRASVGRWPGGQRGLRDGPPPAEEGLRGQYTPIGPGRWKQLGHLSLSRPSRWAALMRSKNRPVTRPAAIILEKNLLEGLAIGCR